jgi:hypothetical protein
MSHLDEHELIVCNSLLILLLCYRVTPHPRRVSDIARYRKKWISC